MAKKLVAVTNVKHDSGFYPAGEEIDSSKFSKDELVKLHDAGAIAIKDTDAEESEPELTGAGTPVPATDVDPTVPVIGTDTENNATGEDNEPESASDDVMNKAVEDADPDKSGEASE